MVLITAGSYRHARRGDVAAERARCPPREPRIGPSGARKRRRRSRSRQWRPRLARVSLRRAELHRVLDLHPATADLRVRRLVCGMGCGLGDRRHQVGGVQEFHRRPADGNFWESARLTLYYAGLSVPLTTAAGLADRAGPERPGAGPRRAAADLFHSVHRQRGRHRLGLDPALSPALQPDQQHAAQPRHRQSSALAGVLAVGDAGADHHGGLGRVPGTPR